MSQKNSAQNVISSYRKSQRMGPFIFGGLAVVLVVVGIVVLIVWLTSPDRPGIALLASATPTATATATETPVTPTATSTVTPTLTLTPTITLTPTRSGPVTYKVQENDNWWTIAAKFGVGVDVLLATNGADSNTFLKVDEEIVIPAPDAKMPTDTPMPASFRGDFTYTVKPGDTLASIAIQFNSTIDAIKTKNKITDANENNIKVGDKLIVPANIITQTPTKVATSTPRPVDMTKTSIAATNPATPTSPPAAVPSATKNP